MLVLLACKVGFWKLLSCSFCSETVFLGAFGNAVAVASPTIHAAVFRFSSEKPPRLNFHAAAKQTVLNKVAVGSQPVSACVPALLHPRWMQVFFCWAPRHQSIGENRYPSQAKPCRLQSTRSTAAPTVPFPAQPARAQDVPAQPARAQDVPAKILPTAEPGRCGVKTASPITSSGELDYSGLLTA